MAGKRAAQSAKLYQVFGLRRKGLKVFRAGVYASLPIKQSTARLAQWQIHIESICF